MMQEFTPTDFVFITDLHITGNCKVRNGDVLEDICKKLEYVIEYCNKSGASLLMGGDIFDKPTVPDYVKSKVAPVFLKAQYPIYSISGNHDMLHGNPEYAYKTSYNVLSSHNVINDLTTVEFNNVVLTSEVPVTTKGKPQIVIFHGFLNQEDGRNTFHFSDLNTTDNVCVLLGHDHVEYENFQFTDKIRIIRPGSLLRGVRTDTNLRIPNMIHIKVQDGRILTKKVPIKCRDWEEIFTTKELKITKAQQQKTYDDIISQIRDAQVSDLTFAQAMGQVADPDVVEYAIQVLEEVNLNNSLNKV